MNVATIFDWPRFRSRKRTCLVLQPLQRNSRYQAPGVRVRITGGLSVGGKKAGKPEEAPHELPVNLARPVSGLLYHYVRVNLMILLRSSVRWRTKKVRVFGTPAFDWGGSIRATERLTTMHRDTILRHCSFPRGACIRDFRSFSNYDCRIQALSGCRAFETTFRKINLSELSKACLLKVFGRFAVISGPKWRSPPTADNFFLNEAKKGY